MGVIFDVGPSPSGHGRKEGIKQFIDDKTYRPGLGAYARDQAE